MPDNTFLTIEPENLVAPIDLAPGVSACTDKPLTVEQFCELVDEDTNAELVEGIIVTKSPVSEPHEGVFEFLYNLLSPYVQHRKLGRVRGPKTLVRISRHTGREPDLIFVSRDRLDIVRTNFVAGAPDLAIEIVSPHDRPHDLIAKQTEYESVGVREFWLIDQPKKGLKVFDLNDEGLFEQRPLEGGVLEAKTVPGFHLQVDWLWSELDHFPSTLAIVQDLLNA